MKNIIQVVILLILTTFYFFPFSIFGIAAINTKMVMAGVSLVVLGIRLIKDRNAEANRDFFTLSVFAVFVSLASYCAVVYNSTRDYTYVSYVISMWVWLGGAYLLVNAIRWLRGRVSVSSICNLVIAVSVLQCIVALLIDKLPFIYDIALTLDPSIAWGMDRSDRLFGIGCGYDVAGIRFSCVMVMIAHLLYDALQDVNTSKLKIACYWLSFVIIGVVGNMIARTTTVGIVFFVLYLVVRMFVEHESSANKRVLNWFVCVITFSFLLISYLYNTDSDFRGNLRFAFEGFFSLWEDGEWQVSSNDILFTMYRFPDSLKTWIIGDGYIESAELDPYYVGEFYLGYYKGIDVGYLRFIYYHGLIGLVSFIIFLCYSANVCVKRIQGYRMLFIFILLVNFICWLKVATDVFSVFAMFLVLSIIGENNYTQSTEIATIDNDGTGR